MKQRIIAEMKYRTNGGTSYHCKRAVELYNTYDFIRDLWDYNPSAYTIKHRFTPKLSKTEMPQSQCNLPHENGVYMVGTTSVNPYTGRPFFWIKVGQGKDMADRVHQYGTYNPTLWKASYMILDYDIVNDVEKFCHKQLNKISKSRGEGSREWYEVSREDYIALCENGFNYFKELKSFMEILDYCMTNNIDMVY